ncbi:MAG: acyl-CoA dehydrogenase family protein [Actinomycetota bacterium]|nr:acyl-CoA dehydrogenase family protein [Actinomycetota bacterium]
MSLTDGEIHRALSERLERRNTDSSPTVLGAGSDDLGAGKRYLELLVDGGWMVPTWPVAAGGRDADTELAARISSALAEYEGVDLYPYGVGLSLVGPVLLELGNLDQQARWLRSIADGSEIWCQMFSEPDAGSDLANVRTRAERDGDEWILGGSKVWTSRGAYSRWGMCLARTDPGEVKHRGLTMFAVDMHGEGVEVRTLEQMNGDRHFSEVFVNGARVPDDDRIGEVGSGWAVAVQTLALERASLGGRTFGGSDASESGLPGWFQAWLDAGLLSDPVRRQEAMRTFVSHRVNQMTAARIARASETGHGLAGSGAKLRSVALFKARAYLTKDLAGASGMLSGSSGHLEFLTAPSMSIRGGTDEVQRNIVGERVLGLPAEPRVDKDVPWRDIPQGG